MSNKVVEFSSVRKKEVLPTKRPCSFTAISDKGKKLYGIAAFLTLSKRSGGVDSFLTQCVDHTITLMSEKYGTK